MIPPDRKIFAWTNCLVSSLFFFFAFIVMNIFNSIAPQLSDALHLSGHQLGLLSGSYLFANVIFLIPAGILIDKFSVRKILAAAMLFSAVLLFFFSKIQSLQAGMIINFLIGICSTCCFLAPVKLIKQSFPDKKIVVMTGAVLSFSMLGGIIANTVFVSVATQIGWRSSLAVLAAVALIFAAFQWFFIIDSQQRNTVPINKKRFKFDLKIILGGIYNSSLNLIFPILGADWGMLYLTRVFAVSNYQAGAVISMLFIGMAAGSFLIGLAADKFIKKPVLMLLSAASSLVIIFILRTSNTVGFYELVGMFLFWGFLSGSQTIGYALAAELSTEKTTALNVGIVSVIVMLGGAVMQPVYGFILDQYAEGATHIENFTRIGFNRAMTIFIIAYTVCVLIGVYFYLTLTKTKRRNV